MTAGAALLQGLLDPFSRYLGLQLPAPKALHFVLCPGDAHFRNLIQEGSWEQPTEAVQGPEDSGRSFQDI